MTDLPEEPPVTALPLDSPSHAAAYADALGALPPGALPSVLALLGAAAEAAERGDPEPLRHVLASLLGTARLERTEAYDRAVADADATETPGTGRTSRRSSRG